MTIFDQIIEDLQKNEDVEAVFLTGSHGTKQASAHSDIDLIVILKENVHDLYASFQWIDGTFADIFFFDLRDIERLQSTLPQVEDPLDVMFITWLQKSEILFDKSNALTSLKESAEDLSFGSVSEKEKRNVWQKINYNYVANKRYFNSNDPLYHQALEMRLLYSVIELVTGYLSLRDIPWRGEKQAVKFLQKDAPKFYEALQHYYACSDLRTRFATYETLVQLVFTDEYAQWTEEELIVLRKDHTVLPRESEAITFVEGLFRK